VTVDFPYSDRAGSKIRPSLVVQADTLNRARADTILAIITSAHGGRPTEFLIDIAQEPGSGLRFNSSVQCDTLVMLD
jgi:mRNA-degrading endonuclease toxin of MazEF toxin-antitoxin module